MAEITGMWLQEPDPTPPDVVAEGGWTCDTCGFGWMNATSTWAQMSLRFKCYCGTVVEVVPPAQSDGTADER
jgi:hypothetical protein